MADIAGIPFVEANFNKDGNPQNAVDLPAGTTDVFIVSHGWNNNNRTRKNFTTIFSRTSTISKRTSISPAVS